MCYRQYLLIIATLLHSFTASAELPDIDDVIDRMPLKTQVGQFFIFGFTGSKYEQSLKKQIDHLHPGAVIVFGRNIKSLNQVRKLNAKAQSESLRQTKVPLLIAVDQEGGKVIRIKTSPSLPSARTLALTQDQNLVQDAGYVTGRLMTALGFNMNLAPVVDISNAQYTDFLGNRSFSNQKETVNKMSTAFSKGLIDARVLPTAKHFPGHGGVQTDSHLSTPYKQVTLTQLLFNDLAPYKEMQKNHIPFAIMASHVSYPLIDPSKMPASFSSLLLDNVLRKGIGFDGIILTDDIQMGGARVEDLSVGERAVRAVLAGNDLIMVGWNYKIQRQAVQGVLKAAQSGRISKARIRKSLKRLLKYKYQFYRKRNLQTSLKTELATIPLKKTYEKIFHKVFKNQAPDLDPMGQAMDVYSYSWRFLSTYKEQQKSRLFHLKNKRPWVTSKNTPVVIYHLSGPLTQKILQKTPLPFRKKMVVINSSSQIFLNNESDFKKVINVHSYHPNLGAFAGYHLKPQVLRKVRNPTSSKLERHY